MRLLNEYKEYIGLSSTLYGVTTLTNASLFSRILVNTTGPDDEQNITNFVTSQLLRLADQHWDIVMKNRGTYALPRKRGSVLLYMLMLILFFWIPLMLAVSIFIVIGLLFCIYFWC